MALGLLLLPAVGGYWFLIRFNYTRYKTERHSGHHLLFRSAIVGIVFYCVARALTLIAGFVCPSLTLLWDSHFPQPFTSEVILSLVLSVLTPPVLNKIYDPLQTARKVAADAGEHIELLIDRAFQEERPIELSLRSRKTYIGLVPESGIGTVSNSDTDVVLVPLLSGYRKEDTLEVVITTNYAGVMSAHHGEDAGQRLGELEVVIPLSEVVSARMFDLEVYQSFRHHPNAG